MRGRVGAEFALVVGLRHDLAVTEHDSPRPARRRGGVRPPPRRARVASLLGHPRFLHDFGLHDWACNDLLVARTESATPERGSSAKKANDAITTAIGNAVVVRDTPTSARTGGADLGEDETHQAKRACADGSVSPRRSDLARFARYRRLVQISFSSPSNRNKDNSMTSVRENDTVRSRARALLESPGGTLLLLRGFLGVTFTFAGLQKLASPNFFKTSAPASFAAQVRGAIFTSPLHGALRPALHAPVARRARHRLRRTRRRSRDVRRLIREDRRRRGDAALALLLSHRQLS